MPQKYEIAGMLELLHYLSEKPRRVVITTHWNPDGDAVGSSLGWAHFLRSKGHVVRVVWPNALSKNLEWIPGVGSSLCLTAESQTIEVQEVISQADTVFALDYNTFSRVGESLQTVLERFDGTTVLIDHHQQPDPHFSIVCSDTKMGSTSEMIYDLIAAEGAVHNLSSDAATCLLTGIITDSGQFRFPSTQPSTFRAAAALVERGAEPEFIHQSLFDSSSVSKMHLWGRAMASMSFQEGGRVAVLALSSQDNKECDYSKGDTEGLVNQGLAVQGVQVSAFFREEEQGVKISFRSKGKVNVNDFSREHFQGGGHANAAGGFFQGSLAQALQKFAKHASELFFLILLSILPLACSPAPSDAREIPQKTAEEQQEAWIQQHRDQLTSERKILNQFAADKGWKPEKSGMGWMRQLFEMGNGAPIQNNERVVLVGRATDLKGRVFYSFPAHKPWELTVGKDNAGEVGLHQALLVSKRGDSLVLILPAHLAHGVAGDLNKIPPMSPVVYYLRIRY